MSWLTPDQEERELFDWLEQGRGRSRALRDFWRLGVVLSPALRIEPLLLRNARLRFLPHSDGSLENRFWFSSLIDARSARSVSLYGGLARLMWDWLQGAGADRATRIRQFVEQHTDHWVELDRIEQTLRLSVVGGAEEQVQAGSELRKAVRTAYRLGTEEQQRRLGAAAITSGRQDLARWTTAVLPEFAEALGDHDEIGWLRHYAALVAGDAQGGLIGSPTSDPLPDWMHPGFQAEPALRVRVQLYPGVLEFNPMEEETGHELALPYPAPAPVQLAFPGLDALAPRWERVWPGRRIAVPAGARQLELRTLEGRSYRLNVVGEGAVGGEPSGESLAAPLVIEYVAADREMAQSMESVLRGRGLEVELVDVGALSAAEDRSVTQEQEGLRLRLWSRAGAAAQSSVERPSGEALAVWVSLDATPLPEGVADVPVIALQGLEGRLSGDAAEWLYSSVQDVLHGRMKEGREGNVQAVMQVEADLPIPDNDLEGVRSVLTVDQQGRVGRVEVEVKITHPWVGDLRVTLYAPDGSSALLHDRWGANKHDIVIRHSSDENVALRSLLGSPMRGKWTLQVADLASRDTGKLDRWRLLLEPEVTVGDATASTAGGEDTAASRLAESIAELRPGMRVQGAVVSIEEGRLMVDIQGVPAVARFLGGHTQRAPDYEVGATVEAEVLWTNSARGLLDVGILIGSPHLPEANARIRRVFLSQSGGDKRLVTELMEALTEKGSYEVLVDLAAEPGDEWQTHIQRWMAECHAALVVITPTAMKSDRVLRELGVLSWRQRMDPFFPLILWVAEDLHPEALKKASLWDDPRRVVQGEDVEEIYPEVERELARAQELRGLAAEIADPATPPDRRLVIGDELAKLGDPRPGVGLTPLGLPDMDWVEIPGGPFLYGEENETREVDRFFIARYPVTNAQYQAFIDADGYGDGRWWPGLAKQFESPRHPEWTQPNRPRERVSWYEAVAYCRWLSDVRGYEVRLPTELELERAARGTDGREYPWGDGYRSGYANVDERESRPPEQTTAVGLFPQGASKEGVFDLAGKVWEWCLNDYSDPESSDQDEGRRHAVRGGSWSYGPDFLRSANRGGFTPVGRYDFIGFRVACSSPSRDR